MTWRTWTTKTHRVKDALRCLDYFNIELRHESRGYLSASYESDLITRQSDHLCASGSFTGKFTLTNTSNRVDVEKKKSERI